ncbi:nucleic-acid-binding protein from transposon X-element [Trichonephila clavipes]|nr:nucleic-acid-binding protein from transposon X-element [Trichonephila clavipes]
MGKDYQGCATHMEKWNSDYLNTLQELDRMIGQMVLIKENFLPINTWHLGRILKVYHGSDGKVRVVKVKTQSGEFKRDISKIAVLPINTKTLLPWKTNSEGLSINKLDELEFQYLAIKPKAERPIKVVIKGLPRNSNPQDTENDLVELGYTVEKVSQLIGRITKQPLPIFLVSLPRNIFNAKIFELKKVSFMNVTVDGYDGKGVTQCYSCNRFHHTAENCHFTPRCLKCDEAHQTRDCQIERVEKPYCINCETYGHMANYSGCPKFPKPRKGTQEKTNTYTNTVNKYLRLN